MVCRETFCGMPMRDIVRVMVIVGLLGSGPGATTARDLEPPRCFVLEIEDLAVPYMPDRNVHGEVGYAGDEAGTPPRTSGFKGTRESCGPEYRPEETIELATDG